MLLSHQLPVSDLIRLCHVARLSLSAGLTVRDVFRQLAKRGHVRLRTVAERIYERVEKGDSLTAALKAEEAYFPPLFLALTTVGEQTGHLPEIFHELEKYYSIQQTSWRQIRTRSLLPVIQFFIALCVIALLIFVLGLIGESRGTEPPSVFGFRGTSGAIRFVVICVAIIGGVWAAWLVITRVMQRKAFLDALLLKLPRIGPCIQAFAVGRFALALQMTLDTSLATGRAIRLALQATGNAVYAVYEASAEPILAAIASGEDLTVALGRGHVFPADFLSMAAIGEEGGRIVEIMRHQAAHYQDEAVRRLKALIGNLTGLVWVAYMGFMVAAILILAGLYLRPLGG
jgi:type IV pilus assembly protein PilC